MHKFFDRQFKAIVLLGGELDSSYSSFLKHAPVPIFAADGGAEFLYQHQIIPKLIMGDFDSLSLEAREWFDGKTQMQEYPRDKDLSDAELLFIYLDDYLQGEPFLVLGAGGGRWDHFLFNISLIERFPQAVYCDREQALLYLPQGEHQLAMKDMGVNTFSLLPISSKLTVKIEGAHFPILQDREVKWGETLLLSNTPSDAPFVRITLKTQGCLLHVHYLRE